MLPHQIGRTTDFDAVDTQFLGAQPLPEPFSAVRYLKDAADLFDRTDAFHRSVEWRLRMLAHPDPVHIKGVRLMRMGVRLQQIPNRLGTHRFAHAVQVLELMSRELTDPSRIFSRTEQNYVRIGALTWMLLKREPSGRWKLDARTWHDRDEIVPYHSHVIVRT